MKYTREMHVKRLKSILERKTCDCCPAAKYYNPDSDFLYPAGLLWASPADHPCVICKTFVGVSVFSNKCPCHALGAEEAIRKTLEEIELYEGAKGETDATNGRGRGEVSRV